MEKGQPPTPLWDDLDDQAPGPAAAPPIQTPLPDALPPPPQPLGPLQGTHCPSQGPHPRQLWARTLEPAAKCRHPTVLARCLSGMLCPHAAATRDFTFHIRSWEH